MDDVGTVVVSGDTFTETARGAGGEMLGVGCDALNEASSRKGKSEGRPESGWSDDIDNERGTSEASSAALAYEALYGCRERTHIVQIEGFQTS